MAPITQTRFSISHVMISVRDLPSDQDGAISTTASTARNGQYQRLQPAANRSLPPGGRHNAANASRIGYSATQENANGAIRPANNPPTMPPNDSAT